MAYELDYSRAGGSGFFRLHSKRNCAALDRSHRRRGRARTGVADAGALRRQPDPRRARARALGAHHAQQDPAVFDRRDRCPRACRLAANPGCGAIRTIDLAVDEFAGAASLIAAVIERLLKTPRIQGVLAGGRRQHDQITNSRSARPARTSGRAGTSGTSGKARPGRAARQARSARQSRAGRQARRSRTAGQVRRQGRDWFAWRSRTTGQARRERRSRTSWRAGPARPIAVDRAGDALAAPDFRCVWRITGARVKPPSARPPSGPPRSRKRWLR